MDFSKRFTSCKPAFWQMLTLFVESAVEKLNLLTKKNDYELAITSNCVIKLNELLNQVLLNADLFFSSIFLSMAILHVSIGNTNLGPISIMNSLSLATVEFHTDVRDNAFTCCGSLRIHCKIAIFSSSNSAPFEISTST